MDQRLSYEKLIAGKLQSIPVPDMADAIWARVEAQLDLDMPTDDGGGSAPQSPPSGPGIISWGLSIFVVVLISLFFFKNETNTPNVSNSSSVRQPIIKAADNPIRPPNINADGSRTPATTNTQTPAPVGFPQDSSVTDPMVINPPNKLDSAITNVPPPMIVSSTPKDTVANTKKKKGVSGINENDYKIVPKKN